MNNNNNKKKKKKPQEKEVGGLGSLIIFKKL